MNLAVSFSQELQQAFSAREDDSMFPAKLPSKLKHLAVQCGPSLSLRGGKAGLNAGARLKDEVMMKNLSSLEEQVSGHRTRFSLLPRSTTDISSDILREHWVDRLRGKDGCW